MDDSDIEGFDKFVEENWGVKIKDGYAGVEQISNVKKPAKKEVTKTTKAVSKKTTKKPAKKETKAK